LSKIKVQCHLLALALPFCLLLLLQLADTYHFFIQGMGAQLWSSAPEVLRPAAGSVAAGAGRPRGGLQLKFYGYDIGRQISGATWLTRLALLGLSSRNLLGLTGGNISLRLPVQNMNVRLGNLRHGGGILLDNACSLPLIEQGYEGVR
jgi:hypothetical protein